MADYERPSFNREWWGKVQDYLRNNPEEGFTEDEVKQFIKYCVNKEMSREEGSVTAEQIQELIEELRSD